MLKIPERIVVVGNSTAAVSAANKLRTRIPEKDAEIILVSGNTRHEYVDSSVFLPVNYLVHSSLSRPMSGILRKSVKLVDEGVKHLNCKDTGIITNEGHLIRYTYLVIADEPSSDISSIPGYSEDARSLGDIQLSLSLKVDVENMKKGNIVIGNAPSFQGNELLASDFAILLSNTLMIRGLSDDVKVTVFFPRKELLGSKDLYLYALKALKSNGIDVVEEFPVSSINVKNKEMSTPDGKTMKYDVPVIMPPQSLRGYISHSDIPVTENGVIDISPEFMNIKGMDNAFAIGGCYNTRNSSMVYPSLEQADFVSAVLANRISGFPFPEPYKYSNSSTLLTGQDKAATFEIGDDFSLEMGRETHSDYLFKLYAHSSYFGRNIRGFL